MLTEKDKEVVLKTLGKAAAFATLINDSGSAFSIGVVNALALIANLPEVCVSEIVEFFIEDMAEQGFHGEGFEKIMERLGKEIKNEYTSAN